MAESYSGAHRSLFHHGLPHGALEMGASTVVPAQRLTQVTRVVYKVIVRIAIIGAPVGWTGTASAPGSLYSSQQGLCIRIDNGHLMFGLGLVFLRQGLV